MEKQDIYQDIYPDGSVGLLSISFFEWGLANAAAKDMVKKMLEKNCSGLSGYQEI